MSADLLTPADMAEEFGVPTSTVLAWNKANDWPHVRVGRRTYWTPEQLAEILRRQTVAPDTTALPGQTRLSASRGRS